MRKPSLPDIIANEIIGDYLSDASVKPGDQLPSVAELTRVYGVSTNTLVHALSTLEKQSFIVKIHGKGCFVADRNASDRPRLAVRLGLLLPFRRSEVVMRMYEGVEAVARRHDCHLLFRDRGPYDTERQQVHALVDDGCQAIVLAPAARTPEQLESDYLNNELAEFPIVLIGSAHPEHMRTAFVFDNYQAAYEITKTLAAQGHRRIAFMDIGDPPERYLHWATRERYRGYRDALQADEVEFNAEDRWIIGESWEPGQSQDRSETLVEYLRDWNEAPDRPTAIIALEDTMAVETVKFARAFAIRIPEQLRVVGFDNLSIARLCHPPIPTTAPDFRRQGELTTEAAISQITSGVGRPKTYVLPVPLANWGDLPVHEQVLPPSTDEPSMEERVGADRLGQKVV